MKCEICNKKFKNILGLSCHIKLHNIKKKEYYDKYLIKNGEGICLNCSENTNFFSMGEGYLSYCSTKCVANSKIVRNKAKETNLKLYGIENPGGSIESINKIKKTKLERYGDENYCNPEGIKKTKLERYGDESYVNPEKMKQTKFERYGDSGFHNVEKMKQTKIERGLILPDDCVIEGMTYKQYKRKVIHLTKKVRKELFNEWDGLDFYDKENISDNVNLHYSSGEYPTIDHKISTINGFKDKIAPNVIANKSNLCITKRLLNSKKNSNNYDEI